MVEIHETSFYEGEKIEIEGPENYKGKLIYIKWRKLMSRKIMEIT